MKKNKKKLIIIALFVVTLGMGIGYSILSKQLKIEGTATIDQGFNIEITSIEKLENIGEEIQNGYGIGGLYETSKKASEVELPSYTSTTAKFNVRLELDSSITYLVTIENKGNIAAVFDAAEILKTGSKNIVLKTPVDIENVHLYPGHSFKYVVTLSYPYGEDLSEEISSDVSINFNAKQISASSQRPVNPYIVFSSMGIVDGNYKDFNISVINLNTENGDLYDHGSMNLYLSVDGSDYEKVSYKTFTEGDNHFEHFYNSNNIKFTMGDTFYDNLSSGVHTLKFKLSDDSTISSNEITLNYYKQ